MVNDLEYGEEGEEEKDDQDGDEQDEDDEGDAEKSSEQRLMRVHRNLGHPSNRLLVQILKEAKAPTSIIEIATKLQCPMCARHVRTAPARPANPTKARELGHTVAMDFSYHTTPTTANA